MTQIKESSTIQENKKYALEKCPVTYVMEKIGGYWKPIIMYHLIGEQKRYSELRRAIPAISEKMLIQHLKQLEQDQLIIRNARPEVPPYVTYHLSNAGNGLVPIITSMAEWAFRDINGDFK